ncbi:MAG TPA: peptidase M28 [Elusimicrobia bacterium]|nr:peptidase M28 [Elusimicrobiota bacterium]HBT61124.1 peptidase M28 [Elusimicrobiota bacterium]
MRRCLSDISLKRVMTITAAAAATLLALLWLLIAQPGVPGTVWPAPEADAGRLRSHVRLLSVDMAPRDAEHPANLDRVAAYVRAQLKASGGRVFEQVYWFGEWNARNRRVERGPYRNVIAAFGPDTAERLVVGAHYDSYGVMPGADDNASGVAGLLELGRLLGRRPPRIRTELVAFSLEEPPYFATEFMGSAQYAARLKSQGVRVRAMLALEMIGYFPRASQSQSYPALLLRLFYPSRGDFIAVVGKGDLNRLVKRAMRRVRGLPVCSIAAPSVLPGIDFSDHRSFWAQGYPAVMITDTAFYRNRNYHTAKDTIETLDFQRMAQVVDGVRAAVQDLDR